MLKNNFAQQLPTVKPIPVEVPLIPWTIYRDTDNEPQPFTTKTSPTNEVIINTRDLPAGVPRNNFTLGNGIIFISNCSRIRPVSAEFFNWFIPNVNPTNNTFTFFSSFSGTTHTVVLAPGYYDDADNLMDDIVTTLNTVSGSSGIIFSSAAVTNYPRTYTLTSTNIGRLFYFDPTCTAFTNGDTVYGLRLSTTPAQSVIVGAMMLRYTLWLDICSTTLTKYGKIRSITSNGRSSIFARTGLTDQVREIEWGDVYDSFDSEAIIYSFRPAEVVTSIDIQLYDSHGNLLYIPPELENTLIFQLTFRTEL